MNRSFFYSLTHNIVLDITDCIVTFLHPSLILLSFYFDCCKLLILFIRLFYRLFYVLNIIQIFCLYRSVKLNMKHYFNHFPT